MLIASEAYASFILAKYNISKMSFPSWSHNSNNNLWIWFATNLNDTVTVFLCAHLGHQKPLYLLLAGSQGPIYVLGWRGLHWWRALHKVMQKKIGQAKVRLPADWFSEVILVSSLALISYLSPRRPPDTHLRWKTSTQCHVIVLWTRGTGTFQSQPRWNECPCTQQRKRQYYLSSQQCSMPSELQNKMDTFL